MWWYWNCGTDWFLGRLPSITELSGDTLTESSGHSGVSFAPLDNELALVAPDELVAVWGCVALEVASDSRLCR